MLSYATYMWEIQGKKEEGSKIAKKAFDRGMEMIDNLDRECILLLQLLRNNLTLWIDEDN